MFRWIGLYILIRIVQSTDDQYLFSNFHLQPEFAILNSTSKRTFLCTKRDDNNDDEDFEITTHPHVPFERIKIYEKRLNNTAIEITVEAHDYIGYFKLVCSSLDNRRVGIEADVLVGSHPDSMSQVDNCLVFENKYIDCTIRAPIMAMAIENKYPCHFDLNELHANAYKQPPDIVRTDQNSQTITFRWFPLNETVFPMDTQVLIIGEMRFFGSTKVIINLTPNYYVRSNFTLKTLSPSDIEIEFHTNYFSNLICYGNASLDDQSQQNIRRFKKSNPTKLRLTNLLSNTRYRVCSQCYRTDNVTTISERFCQRIRTNQKFYWLIYLFIGIAILFSIVLVILICTIMNWTSYIKRRLCISRTHENPQDIELPETLVLDEIETKLNLDEIFNETNDEEKNPLNESIPLTSSNAE